MKKITTPILIALCSILLFSACSVERRHYRPGFHVVNKTTTKPTETAKTDNAPVEIAAKSADAFMVEASTTYSGEAKPAVAVMAETEKPAILHKEKAAEPVATATTEKTYHKGTKELKSTHMVKKAMKGGPMGMLGDDQIIAIILCIFLGWIGVHRFYLGYTVSGIVYILLFLGWLLLWGFLGPIGWICGVLLFVFIILDLIFLILDKPLFFAR